MEQKLNQLLDEFAKLNEDKNSALNSEHYDYMLEAIQETRKQIIDLFNSR